MSWSFSTEQKLIIEAGPRVARDPKAARAAFMLWSGSPPRARRRFGRHRYG
jgi:hypothetical protein